MNLAEKALVLDGDEVFETEVAARAHDVSTPNNNTFTPRGREPGNPP